VSDATHTHTHPMPTRRRFISARIIAHVAQHNNWIHISYSTHTHPLSARRLLGSAQIFARVSQYRICAYVSYPPHPHTSIIVGETSPWQRSNLCSSSSVSHVCIHIISNTPTARRPSVSARSFAHVARYRVCVLGIRVQRLRFRVQILGSRV